MGTVISLLGTWLCMHEKSGNFENLLASGSETSGLRGVVCQLILSLAGQLEQHGELIAV